MRNVRGATSLVSIGPDKVIKKLREDMDRSYAKGLFDTEVYWLTRLEDCYCTPNLLEVDPKTLTITMTFAGAHLNEGNCPKDFATQLGDILKALAEHNCIHCDIKTEEILVLDDKIMVVDFGWATDLDKPVPAQHFKMKVAGGYRPKDENGNHYYDDKHMLVGAFNACTRQKFAVKVADIG